MRFSIGFFYQTALEESETFYQMIALISVHYTFQYQNPCDQLQIYHVVELQKLFF